MDVFIDAFTPCRNLLFLTLGAAYAIAIGARAVSIGLLTEERALFPDQTEKFLAVAEEAIAEATGHPIKILAPLMSFAKPEVVAMAERRGIRLTYSCHAGLEIPCGVCVACREFNF